MLCFGKRAENYNPEPGRVVGGQLAEGGRLDQRWAGPGELGLVAAIELGAVRASVRLVLILESRILASNDVSAMRASLLA